MDLEHGNTDIFRSEIAFKNSLKTKLILLITGFIAVTAISLSYFYSQSSDRIILEHYSRQRLLQEQLQSAELFDGISSARRDLEVLKNAPILHSLIEQLDKSPSSATSENWKNRLSQTFISYMKASPDYMQMRLVGVHNGGYEIVRVDKRGDKPFAISKHDLQNKSRRDYYQAIVRLKSGEIYTSDINLNREFGKISIPYTPTIRIATPLYVNHGGMFAFLIINIDLTHAFNTVRKLVEPGARLYIINKRGDYLVNPDRAKEFAFDFGHVERLQYDFPELANSIKDLDDRGFDKEVKINNQQQFLHAFLLASGYDLGNNRMTAIQIIPRDVLFKDMHKTENISHLFASILTLFSIMIALLFSQRILSPIRFLIKAAVSAAKGTYTKDEFPNGNDEIGLLSRSFRKMIQRIEQRESDIRDNQARYKAIFSGADASIAIVDINGNIEEANDSFCAMLGISNHEARQSNIIDMLIEKNTSVEFIDSNCQECALNKFCLGEVKLQSNDGSIIPVMASLNHFTTATGKHCAIYMHDLRQQRAAEEDRMKLLLQLKQAHKMESVGLLASGIAHDFNNVLSCVSGYSELIRDTDNTSIEDRDNYLNEILGAADKAKEMIRNLMLYSRSEHTSFHTEDVQKAIFEIIAVLEHALTSRVILTYDIDLADAAMDIAPFQLQQIILNLCINARDAMGGSGSIHIDAHAVELQSKPCSSCASEFGGNYIQLTVKDNGPGIEPDKVIQMFEPFYTTKDADKGTGLGLYMVHTIVHEAGGHVLVETHPGECCSFTIYLPYSQKLYQSDSNSGMFGSSVA